MPTNGSEERPLSVRLLEILYTDPAKRWTPKRLRNTLETQGYWASREQVTKALYSLAQQRKIYRLLGQRRQGLPMYRGLDRDDQPGDS